MSKEEIGFYWTATFSDGSVLEQFDVEDNEVLFSEITNNPLSLKEFKITSSEEDELYIVNLFNGNISTSTRNYEVRGSNPTLIYFRRNRVQMSVGETMKFINSTVVHHIGMKTDINEIKFEIFKGLESRPRKIMIVDVVASTSEDITNAL